jgi:hypothetical protein
MLCWRLHKTQGVETIEKAYEAHALHLVQFFKTLSFQGMEIIAFITKCYAMSKQLRALESETRVSSAVLNDFGLLTKKLIAFVLGMLEKYDYLIERGLEKKDSRIRTLYKDVLMKNLNNEAQRAEAFKKGKEMHNVLDGWHDFMGLFSKKVASLLSASPLYKQYAHIIDGIYLNLFDPFLSGAFITWHDVRPQALAKGPQTARGVSVPQFSFDLMKEIIK